jgi:hypothetical protein
MKTNLKDCKKLQIRTLITLFFTFQVLTLELYSQVTVGSDIAPAKGALFDVKTQIPDKQNITSSSGGIVLPRVRLKDVNKLEPFISDNDPDIDDLKKKHVGLTVYNLSSDAGFVSGLYVWSGQKWLKKVDDIPILPEARNGLYIHDNTVKLGKDLVRDTEITQSDKNMGFITGSSGEWNVNTDDFAVFGDGSVGIGDSSHPADTRLLVGGNTNMDGNVTVTAGTTLLKKNTVIDGTLTYNYNTSTDNSSGHAGKYLQAIDDAGTAEWAMPKVGGDAVMHSNNATSGSEIDITYYADSDPQSKNFYFSNKSIDLPPGKWLVKFTFLMRRTPRPNNLPNNKFHQKCWVSLGLARRKVYNRSTTNSADYEPYDKYRDRHNPSWPVYVECVLDSSYDYTSVTGDVVIDNFAIPGDPDPAGGTYDANGFDSMDSQKSGFNLVFLKELKLLPDGNASWNWGGLNLRLNGNASENVIVAFKLD